MLIKMDDKEKVILNLEVDKEKYRRWENFSNKMCLSIYEYIRRCVDAHTNILDKDSFHLVPYSKN